MQFESINIKDGPYSHLGPTYWERHVQDGPPAEIQRLKFYCLTDYPNTIVSTVSAVVAVIRCTESVDLAEPSTKKCMNVPLRVIICTLRQQDKDQF